ncbi:MAG: class I SAM-dependent methyltransferase [Bacteroidales bacterium]|nr:class I SAM-dependent methyltransferase [Bacteroidales bacterium]
MKHEYPENFARFYDLIYHHMRDSVDNDYFQNVIKQTKGKVLEIGVGTGRLFSNALNQGADIYGLDISHSMLNVLYKKLPEDQHYRISLQNVIDFKFDFKFDLIIAPFRVIMHVLEKDEQIRTLNNVYDHLEKSGKFIFDAFVPDLNQLLNGIDNQVDFEGEYEPGKKIRRTVSTNPDLINQLINIRFCLEWDEDNKLKHEEWRVPLRYYFRYELEHLVERSKFEKYKIFGDYQGTELNQKSREFITICQKG